MPWRLYGHLLKELLKTMALTTGILVTVIAFGAAIKPLAQNLLGPMQTMLYVSIATVPMMQFALPFAAGFAATLVLHRMAVENEIMALSACGMSYRKMLYPLAGLGMLLLIIMLGLGHWIIPKFAEQLTRIVTKDAPTLLVSQLQRGETFRFDDHQIYADEIHTVAQPPGTDAELRLLLIGLVAVKGDPDQDPEVEFTAEYATVDIYRRPGTTYLKFALGDSTSYSRDQHMLVSAPEATPEAVRILQEANDSPKYWTLNKMQQFRTNPDVSSAVRMECESLDNTLRQLDDWRAIVASIGRTGVVELAESTGRWTYRIEADTIAQNAALTHRDGSPVVIDEFDRGKATRRATAELVSLVPNRAATVGRPQFVLHAPDAQTVSLQSGLSNVGRWDSSLLDLSLPTSGPSPPRRDARTLIELADRTSLDQIPLASKWKEWIGQLTRKIESEIHEKSTDLSARILQRWAISLTAPLLLLTGAVLAMWRRHSLPLQIYMLAFIPSILDILLISGGEQMFRGDKLFFGTIVMWSGNAILLGTLLTAYFRLSRN